MILSLVAQATRSKEACLVESGGSCAKKLPGDKIKPRTALNIRSRLFVSKLQVETTIGHLG